MTKRPNVAKKFKVALAVAGISQRNFAKANSVTVGCVSQVAHGLWVSGRTYDAIEGFINKHLPLDWQARLDRENK
jgi:hypothetical protein